MVPEGLTCTDRGDKIPGTFSGGAHHEGHLDVSIGGTGPRPSEGPNLLMPRTTSSEAGLVAARLALGVFFLFEGWDKLPWVLHPDMLASILSRWAAEGSSLSRWYVHTLCLPGVPVFARLIFFGEVAAGLALIFGLWTRTTAIILILLVLNIHLAHNTLLQYSFLSKGDGLPVLGGLMALAIGGAKLPLSIRKRK